MDWQASNLYFNHESSTILYYILRTGVSLIVGDIEGKQQTGCSRQHDSYYYDEFWKVGIVVIVWMLIIYQQINGDNQQDQKGHRCGDNQKDVRHGRVG